MLHGPKVFFMLHGPMGQGTIMHIFFLYAKEYFDLIGVQTDLHFV